MTVFVTDTHAMIWRLVAPAKLAGSADQAFNQALVMASTRLSSIPDIFDRLVAAETIAKGATLISRDHVFSGVVGLQIVPA